MRSLAMLSEMEEIFVSTDSEQLEEAWTRAKKRKSWMETGVYAFPTVEHFLTILTLVVGLQMLRRSWQ